MLHASYVPTLNRTQKLLDDTGESIAMRVVMIIYAVIEMKTSLCSNREGSVIQFMPHMLQTCA